MPIQTNALVSLATQVFSSTTGCSENILNVYDKHKGNPKLLDLPLTPTNVQRIVQAENVAALNGPSKRLADRLAKAATPFRSILAHGAAQQLVTSREGHFADNEYSRAALEGLTTLF